MLSQFLLHPPETPFCVILGDPVSHSLSPALHGEAFRRIRSEWTYLPLRVTQDDLQRLPELFALSGFRGANVTVPHKSAVVPLIDVLDPLAADIGAVNTIVKRDGAIHGYNTDMDGFLDPLRPLANDLHGREAMVFGSGGARNAVVAGLRRLGLSRVRTVSRSPLDDDPDLIPYESVVRFAENCALFVNATPLGLPHLAGRSPLDGLELRLRTGQIGYDLLYKPKITPFLERFRDADAVCIGGMDMFIGQAKRSFRLWTGVPMPEEALHALD